MTLSKGAEKMEEIVNLFINNGVAVACLIYFMWYNNTTMKEFTSKFEDLQNSILKIYECINSHHKEEE